MADNGKSSILVKFVVSTLKKKIHLHKWSLVPNSHVGFLKTFNMHLLQYADTPPTPIIRSSFSLASSEKVVSPGNRQKIEPQPLGEIYEMYLMDRYIYTYLCIFCNKRPKELEHPGFKHIFYIYASYIYIYML